MVDEQEPEDPIFGKLIYGYSRKQAIEDGVLVDVIGSDLPAQAGIKYPVALTRAVWDEYVAGPGEEPDPDWRGRLWDILWLFRQSAKNFSGDTLIFDVLIAIGGGRPRPVSLKAVCGPGDTPDPVITIMKPEED